MEFIMAKKPLPPLLEGWVKEMQNTQTNIYIRENYCREIENVRDRLTEAIQLFSIERNKVIDSSRSRRKKR